ncbi:MAG: cytochrome c [Planctomycetota bacterium]|jgi:cytochrome c556
MATIKPSGLNSKVFAGNLLTMVIILAACSASPRWRYQQRLLNTGKPALHAVHNHRIKEIMNELNKITSDPLWYETTYTLEYARATREIAQVAASMAQTAKIIPDNVNRLQLNQEEKQIFLKLAQKLHNQAAELEQRAKTKNIDDIPSLINRITNTCTACHTAFRIPT